MKKQLGIGFSVLALAGVLAGCGGGPDPATAPPTTPTTAPATSSPAAPAELTTAASKAGQIVVDGKGMSVYAFTKDTKDAGTSACTGACTALWPAVTTTSDAPVAAGVTGTIGTIPTADGKKHVTLNGMPLYYFANDKAAGDVLGHGVNNVWFLVSASGTMVTAPAAG